MKITKDITNSITTRVPDYLIMALKEFKVELRMNELDAGYNELNKIIRNLDKDQYDEHRFVSKDKNICALMTGSHYFINLGNLNFFHVNVMPLGETTPWLQEMVVSFYGKDARLLKKKLLNKLSKKMQNDDITIYQIGSQYTEYKVKPHDFSSVVLYPEVKKNIISGLTNWKVSTEWYKNHQMVHKIGVLLYGEPGCGKSSVVRAISTLFNNAPILMLDAINIESSIRDLISKRRLIDGPMIVVFEDFDMLFFNRDDYAMDDDCNNGGIMAQKPTVEHNKNQNLMFQVLDGMYSMEDTIYIATTNHIDRIDPAMVRHGRFDIQEELKPFDEIRTAQFLKLFGLDNKFINSEIIDRSGLPIQPAKLQALIMEYRANQLMDKYKK